MLASTPNRRAIELTLNGHTMQFEYRPHDMTRAMLDRLQQSSKDGQLGAMSDLLTDMVAWWSLEVPLCREGVERLPTPLVEMMYRAIMADLERRPGAGWTGPF